MAAAGMVAVTALVAAYQWTQSRYYVGADGNNVAIYKGVQQDLGPITLSDVYRQTDISLESLSSFSRRSIEATITADDLADAERIVSQLEASVVQ